jgi:hypothetical protein
VDHGGAGGALNRGWGVAAGAADGEQEWRRSSGSGR